VYLLSTLTVNKKKLETLPLTVYQTFYRPDGDNGKDYTQDTLYSVFFSVPNEYIEKYGEMTAVHAEWLEAVTKYMYLTGNKDVYNAFSEYIGIPITDDCEYGFLGGTKVNDVTNEWNTIHQYTGNIGYNFSYSADFHWDYDEYALNGVSIDTLYWLFATPDFSANSADGYILPAEDMLEYARNYSKGKDNLIDGTVYSKDLFESWNDSKTEVRYTKDQTFTLNSYSYSGTFLSILMNSHAYANSTNDSITVNRIQKVDKCESAEQVEQDYCIDQSDYGQLVGLMSDDSTVYVFHFAVSDYYATECFEFDNTGALHGDKLDSNARLFQETAYLGFDIIDVTFTNETGKQKVVGVVANPIDVMGDSTPALNTTADSLPDWLPYALAIAGVLTAALAVTRIVKSNTEDKKQ
jgi:hypothetical protein